jgi:glycosyltransferase involved in cell wall biosynthesis
LGDQRKTLMQVSVLIPVYNAAPFVRQAVESALAQSETAEVILVEDGSPDDSWEVCQKLAAEYPKVHLYRHPDGRNHGAGATRNLAIRESSCKYIAFLDADDYFLPDRFTTARQLFEFNPDIDGVYEAIAMHIENAAGALRWRAAERSQDQLHTMTKRVLPEALFNTLILGGSGDFSIDGLVLKREVIEKSGYMDDDLPLHQDTAFIYKVAGVARLVSGNLDQPVTRWRVHDHNRISAPRPKSLSYKMKLKFWYTLWKWSLTHISQEQQRLLLNALIDDARYRSRFDKPFSKRLYGLQKRVQLLLLLLDYPALIFRVAFWEAFFKIRPVRWFKGK